MQQAVASAKEAFKTWSQSSILSRQQVMFRYQDIIRKNMVSGAQDSGSYSHCMPPNIGNDLREYAVSFPRIMLLPWENLRIFCILECDIV
jgi:ornithine carbamoyltransferase